MGEEIPGVQGILRNVDASGQDAHRRYEAFAGKRRNAGQGRVFDAGRTV